MGVHIKENPTTREISDTAPKYRYISKGLNLYGKCDNKKCDAYEKEVICMMKGVKEFDFFDADQAKNVKCPLCAEDIYVDNCGLYNCKYKFQGKKFKNVEEGDEEEEVKLEGECPNEYKEFPKGNLVWTELTVKIEYL